MKAISLLQPWASLIASGAKVYETRSWSTSHRGPLAIHASLSEREGRDYFEASTVARMVLGNGWARLPRGKVVAIVELTDCFQSDGRLPNDGAQFEGSFGNFARGRWLWKLKLVEAVDPPVPARGALSLWEWSRQ